MRGGHCNSSNHATSISIVNNDAVFEEKVDGHHGNLDGNIILVFGCAQKIRLLKVGCMSLFRVNVVRSVVHWTDEVVFGSWGRHNLWYRFAILQHEASVLCSSCVFRVVMLA